MTVIMVGLIIFAVSILVIEMCFYAYRASGMAERKDVRRRLKKVSSTISEMGVPEIVTKRVLSEIPLLNKILLRVQVIERLERLVEQANVKHSLGFYVLVALIMASIGYTGTILFGKHHILGIVLAVSLGATPLLYLLRKKRKRMNKLLNQLPDGLDLIARALKAGHAFTTGMKLAADEFEDPLGTELDETLNEINFGVSVPDALTNLATRVDCPDLRYFVVSVIIQRSSGGNLAEILKNISHLVRERIKFQGKLRVLSAEGRLSAVVLIALPFLVMFALLFLNPSYINILFNETVGRVMIGLALIGMVIGALVMKKIVAIEV